MRLFIFTSMLMLSISAQAALNCKASLRKDGIAIESEIKLLKKDGDIVLLKSEIQERIFEVSYNENKSTYILSISDRKTNQGNVMTLNNVTPKQESSGITLASAPLSPGDEKTPSSIIICTRK